MRFRVDATYETHGQSRAMEGLSLPITLVYRERKHIFFSLRTVMLGRMHLADGVREIREGEVYCLLQEVSKNILFVFICEEEVIFTKLFQNSRYMYSAEQNRKDLGVLAGRTCHA